MRRVMGMHLRLVAPCLLMLLSCSAFSGDDSVGVGEPDPTPDGLDAGTSSDGGSSTIVTPPVVDGGAEDAEVVDASPPPLDEVTETYGIFVSSVGTPEGSGTRESPLSSIGAAIAKAKEAGKRVYVCKGTYKEALELKSGVSVLGGYACTTKWTLEQGAYSRVEAPTSPAVRAKDIVDATTFSGFDVVAPNGSAADASSIGLVADNAGKLVVASSKITAGAGIDGSAGVEPAAPVPGSNVDGKPGRAMSRDFVGQPMGIPNRNPGGNGGTSQCGGTPGGAGAKGPYATCTCTNAGANEQCNATVPATCYSAPGVKDSTCQAGAPGAGTGTAGTSGTDGASAGTIGSLSSAGYVPANGAAGTNGNSGAGGSGGAPESVNSAACTAGARVSYASGAGGGAGGCGGSAGTPGKGGGASIAALVWSSPGLTFDGTELAASTGGAGGKGTLGAAPTAGGKAGATASGAGAASNGGNGGRPGVSGSGAGGPSFGVAFHGPAPTFANGALAKAAAGGAGVGADSKTFGQVTWTLKASAAGLSKDQYEF